MQTYFKQCPFPLSTEEEAKNIKIIVLYDNDKITGEFKTSHGFSALIKLNDFDILFDAGWSGPILLYNLKHTGYTFTSLKYIFLSHQHWDHIGGVPDVLNTVKKHVTFVIPSSFTKGFKNELSRFGDIMEIGSDIKEFEEGLYSTGEMSSGIGLKEQGLFIENKRTLIVGCSHPDVYNMVRRFKNVHMLLGGFHGFSDIHLLDNIVEKTIYPCHCTIKKEEILKLYPDKAKKCGTGLEVEL